LLQRSETYSSSALNELRDRIVPGVQVAYRSRQRIAVLDGARGGSAADTVLRLQATQKWGRLMSVIQEFREFAMRGNVVDLAVGVIMGASFAPIVSSLVDNIIMPPIGYLMAGVDFSTLAVTLPTPTGDGVGIRYGVFLNAVIKFLITAFAIFLLVKAMNRMKTPAPAAAAPPPTPSEIYLKEIRDALVAKT